MSLGHAPGSLLALPGETPPGETPPGADGGADALGALGLALLDAVLTAAAAGVCSAGVDCDGPEQAATNARTTMGLMAVMMSVAHSAQLASAGDVVRIARGGIV